MIQTAHASQALLTCFQHQLGSGCVDDDAEIFKVLAGRGKDPRLSQVHTHHFDPSEKATRLQLTY